jgi:hypothetical protein
MKAHTNDGTTSSAERNGGRKPRLKKEHFFEEGFV